jgi:hypothetical protein
MSLPAHAPSRLVALGAVTLVALAIPASASAKKSASPKLPAKFQQRYHVKSAVADPDHDGLTNLSEYRASTSPNRADTNHNGVTDGSEDRDGDKLDNATEQRAGTDPGKRDGDHDGRSDAREDADHDGLDNLAEQRTANDPGDPDSDDDGVKDGDEHAGQVVSFQDGTLALRLASTGKVVTADVDSDTSVECNATGDYEAGYDDTSSGGDTSSDDGTSSDDTSPDDSGDDAGGDDTSASTSSAGDGSDDPDATTASVRVADDSSDATSPDDATTSDDGTSDGGTGDPCFDEVLAAGAWVHEAELSTDDGGLAVFDAVALVDNGS